MSIHSKDVLDVLRGANRPALALKSILRRLGHSGASARAARKRLRSLLREMVDHGLLEATPDGYRQPRRDGLLEGSFRGRGLEPGSGVDAPTGSVIDDSGRFWEVTTAIPLTGGERVVFRPATRPAEPEASQSDVDPDTRHGQVLQVAGSERREWVGIFESEGGGRVVPYRDADRWEIRVRGRDQAGAKDGEVVVVHAGEAGSRARGHRDRDAGDGRIVECLGMPGDPEADFRAVVWRHRLPREFDPASLSEAAEIPDVLEPAEIERRVDLRERAFVTIDPEDARDHDDALCAESVAGATDSIRLFVAIADVAHYVAEDSALDRGALGRGNSVYFPGHVIPMLPERISGDLCSLRPDRDRFAMVVELVIGPGGEVQRRSFYPGVIRSHARLHYREAAAVMDGDASASQMSAQVRDQLDLLRVVSERLGKKRLDEGSIDFELREGHVVLDDDGRASTIIESERTIAHRCVEEAMLAANRAVARLLSSTGLPSVYRIHEEPDPAKLEILGELLSTFGLLGAPRSPGRAPGPIRELRSLELNRALRRASGSPEEELVNLVALRSMKQARYAVEDRGHFALGFDSYLHFTSPIRRYSDLLVHRSLKKLQSGGAGSPGSGAEQARLDEIAARISYRERVAVDAEREIVQLKKCAFMAGRVGECFDGRITGVTPHGVFVTLDEFYVDGLVHISYLEDDLELDERLHSLVGRRSGRRYRLGDAMRIRVLDVNQIKGWIRFQPEEAIPGARRSRGQGAVRPKSSNVNAGRRPKPRPRRSGAPNRRKGRR